MPPASRVRRDDTSQSGLLITFEGGEGAGKTLQVAAVGERLRERGLEVVATREPGGTPLGEQLRHVLLGDEPLEPLSETLLFMAARSQLVATVIAPALERGVAVLCDRFADSTRAYQGFGRGISLDTIDSLDAIATRKLMPDLTVLLDLPVRDGLARKRGVDSDDRFGREQIEFHERVRRGFLTLAAREPERWLVVDARQPAAVVTDQIWARVERLVEEQLTK